MHTYMQYDAVPYINKKASSKDQAFFSDVNLLGCRDLNSRPPAPKAGGSFLHIYLLFDLRVHD